MKYHHVLGALGLAAMKATAGTPAPVEAPPAPEPSLISGWFIGTTYGQLDNLDANLNDDFDGMDVDDLDLEMFSLHIGRGIANTNGWDFSAYLEVAYLFGDTNKYTGAFNGEDIVLLKSDIDVDIIPVTLNFKVEHQVFGPVSAYLTGGAGYAWTKLKTETDSYRDGGFYAQASAGLIWNINESFELYGGARWVHLKDLDFSNSGITFDDGIAWEVGFRYNF